jgi:hypothetical protein
MHAVVETPGYLKAAEAIFTEAELLQIVEMVATKPECGDIMPGTGGFRKVRVPRAGIGKRGGARVIYILRNEDFPIFLVAAYAKSVKANLTKQERNQLARRADEIFASYGR